MNGYMKRLEKIQVECNVKPANNDKDGKQEEQDEFSRKKKRIAALIKDVKMKIEEREKLELDAPGSKFTVEVSSQIRTQMRQLRDEAKQLQEIYKKEEDKYRKKNKTVPEKEQNLEKQAEIVDIVFAHVKECETRDKRRTVGDNAFILDINKDDVPTELPDIDDVDFKMLRENDDKINNELDQVSGHVQNLKQIAIEMGKEAEKQGIMMDELDTKVEKVNDQLENINARLKKVLKSVRKADRFCVDIILLCVLLGIGGYIYHMVSSRS